MNKTTAQTIGTIRPAKGWNLRPALPLAALALLATLAGRADVGSIIAGIVCLRIMAIVLVLRPWGRETRTITIPRPQSTPARPQSAATGGASLAGSILTGGGFSTL